MGKCKALIAVRNDLASSIAIRYACHLAGVTGLGLQTLYVVKGDGQGQTPGTGWVKQTWEDAVALKGRDNIARLIQAEKIACPGLGNPKIVAGKRDIVILNELHLSVSDIFVEGILHAFDPNNFLKKIRSRLYRNVPCPVLMVKNPASLERGILALGEESDLAGCAEIFIKLFGGVRVDLDLICCRFRETDGAEEAAFRPGTGLAAAEKILAEKDQSPRECRTVNSTSDSLGRSVRNYGLVLASIARERIATSPIVDLLAHTPLPVLIDWR